MRAKKFYQLLVLLAASAVAPQAPAQEDVALEGPTTLEEFRELALKHNRQLMITRERLRKADYQSKEAFAAYLPAIDFTGGYMHNQHQLSIFDSDQLLPTKTFDPTTGTYQFNLVTDPSTGMPVQTADGQYIPSSVALIPKEEMTYDVRNVFFGAITLTQPIFMGGKIVAMNKITNAAKEAALALHNNEVENVIYAVDAAYWQVVSLKAKERLAASYVNLLDTLSSNVQKMVAEGIATRSDALSVDVKLNSARVDLTKVENGLVLSRMVLSQVCGLPVDSQPTLADEDNESLQADTTDIPLYEMSTVFEQRSDLRALEQSIVVAKGEADVARASMLPQLALIGAYEFSNPNMYDGFSKKLRGGFSVGAMLSIPLWHWGGSYNKYRAAKSDRIAKELQLEDAREKVTLQVRQADFKNREALKTYNATKENLRKADENLRTANIAFREGIATTNNVMEAQTAWLKAHSDNIDAAIDVKLCHVYLSKVLGNLNK